MEDKVKRVARLFTLLGIAFALGARAAEEPKGAQENAVPKKELNVRQTFASICGFCHEDYGRKAGKGPQLMDNPNSDEFLFNRIKNGKPGRMAAFGGAFSDTEIRQMVAFMRRLKPNEEPR